MYTQLRDKLWAFIVHNNPDLMFGLQEDYSVTKYLDEKVSKVMPTALKLLEEDKPGHAIHELCLNEMTAELKPSKFLYLKNILKKEFQDWYHELVESGLLTYETVNLVTCCTETFERLHFSEQNKRDSELRKAIRSCVAKYFENNQKKQK